MTLVIYLASPYGRRRDGEYLATGGHLSRQLLGVLGIDKAFRAVEKAKSNQNLSLHDCVLQLAHCHSYSKSCKADPE